MLRKIQTPFCKLQKIKNENTKTFLGQILLIIKTAKSNILQIHFPIKLSSVRKEKKMFGFHQGISFSYCISL